VAAASADGVVVQKNLIRLDYQPKNLILPNYHPGFAPLSHPT
jgi:hypothetical protein